MTEKRHNIFVCYHHCDEDEGYKDTFVNLIANHTKEIRTRKDNFGGITPDTSIKKIKHQIRERILKNTTVTVLLIGAKTWQRKHIDWEISASIMDSTSSGRSGLVGILLPSHKDFGAERINPFTLPPRFHDNMRNGYAHLHEWSENPEEVQDWIHHAFMHRDMVHPVDSFKHYTANRVGQSWHP